MKSFQITKALKLKRFRVKNLKTLANKITNRIKFNVMRIPVITWYLIKLITKKEWICIKNKVFTKMNKFLLESQLIQCKDMKMKQLFNKISLATRKQIIYLHFFFLQLYFFQLIINIWLSIFLINFLFSIWVNLNKNKFINNS